MNVNVRLIRLRCVVFLLFHFYTLSSTIIHSTFGHLRHGWGIQPAHFPCEGLKTSGSRISLGVESVGPFLFVHPIRLSPKKKCLEWCYSFNPYAWQQWKCIKFGYPSTTPSPLTTVTTEVSVTSITSTTSLESNAQLNRRDSDDHAPIAHQEIDDGTERDFDDVDYDNVGDEVFDEWGDYDYEDETNDYEDYEQDWSQKEELTSTTQKLDLVEDLENKGVEIRVGAHINANGNTTKLNPTVDSAVQDTNSTFVNEQNETESENSSRVPSVGDIFDYEVLPIPSPIHQTTTISNDLSFEDLNVNIENNSIIKTLEPQSNIKPAQNLKETSDVREKLKIVPFENTTSTMSPSKTNTSNMIIDYIYHGNKSYVTTMKPRKSSQEVTGEISDIVKEVGSNDMYTDSDEITGIASDPHPRMLTEDLSNLVTTIVDPVEKISENDTHSFDENDLNNKVNESDISTLGSVFKEANNTRNVSTIITFENKSHIEFLPDAESYYADSEIDIQSSTDVDAYHGFFNENIPSSKQNMSKYASIDTSTKGIKINDRLDILETTESFQIKISTRRTVDGDIESNDQNLEETSFDTEKNDTTTSSTQIHLSDNESTSLVNDSWENGISASTESSNIKDSLSSPKSYNSSEDHSLKEQFLVEDLTTEEQTDSTLNSDVIKKERLSNQLEKEETNIWNVNGSQDDPFAYYLEDTLTTKNNADKNVVSKTHNDATPRIPAVELEVTTMSSEVDISNDSNIQMMAKKDLDNKEIVEEIVSHLQYVSNDNILALTNDGGNDKLTYSKESSFDLGESILLSKLFRNTVVLDNVDAMESETTSSPYAYFYLQREKGDISLQSEETVTFSESTENYNRIADEEVESTVEPDILLENIANELWSRNQTELKIENDLDHATTMRGLDDSIFLLNSSSSVFNASEIDINDVNDSTTLLYSNTKFVIAKNLSENFSEEDLNVSNITTDVYIKSNYSYVDAEDDTYNLQSTSIRTLEFNGSNPTIDYDNQNFIFDENVISSKKKHRNDESLDSIETDIDVVIRDRHQPGIKPPK